MVRKIQKRVKSRTQLKLVWVIVFSMFLSFLPGHVPAAAINVPEKVRIGVVLDSPSIDFKAVQGSYSLVDEATGRTIIDTVTNNNLFRAQIKYNTATIEVFRHIDSQAGSAESSQGDDNSNNINNNANTGTANNVDNASGNNQIEGENNTSDSVVTKSENDQSESSNEPVAIIGDWEYWGEYKGPICLKLKNIADANHNTKFGDSQLNLVKCESRRYRGELEIRINNKLSGLLGINELPLEEYLYGVVAREVGKDWPIESIKAQAVCARNYAIRGLSRHFSEGYHLCAGVHCQAYGGYDWEAETCNRAVDETRGRILVDNQGSLAITLYHSNSGGYTENNVNVFGADLYYLRGRPDPYSLGYGLSDWSYTTVINGKNDRGEDGLKNLMYQKGLSVGTITSLELEKYTSGRVKSVCIKDDQGRTITMSGGSFGSLFNPNYQSISRNKVMGRMFEITTDATVAIRDSMGKIIIKHGGIHNSSIATKWGIEEGLAKGLTNYYVQGATNRSNYAKYPNTLEFEGHGWGHGVGMSQWGAYAMGLQGFRYDEILEYYYPGTKIIQTE